MSCWTLYGSEPGVRNIRLWFDGDGLAAYAWFEPPLTVDLTFGPEHRRMIRLLTKSCDGPKTTGGIWPRLGTETIPKAYAMLGAEYAFNQGPG